MKNQTEPTEYRDCVGVMVLNAEGLVFVGRRIVVEGGESWQMPQGGIDPGEDLEAAALRELSEETGMRNVRILDVTHDWLTYDLPRELIGVALRGRYRGQRQKWFAMRYLGDESGIDLNGHTPEFDAYRWIPVDEVPRLIVPFKRVVYEAVVARFRQWATKDK